MDELVKQEIICLLEEKIGISPQSLSKAGWDRIFKERMKRCQITGIFDYQNLLNTSPSEFELLIEELVVPETWFFRDKGAFEFLSYFVKNCWIEMQSSTTQILKIMSLPAATGEEPFSISMTLMDAGFSQSRYLVEGVDISRKCLKLAEKGVYGKNSFRGRDLGFRDRYFEKIPNGYSVKPALKKSVNFYFGNIVDPCFEYESQSYHVVFCRNLLIYLSPRAQKIVFNTINNMLCKDGLLIMGPAETQIAQNAGWEQLQIPKACAFARPFEAQALKQRVNEIKIFKSPKKIIPIEKKTGWNVAEPPLLALKEAQVICDASNKNLVKKELIRKAETLADSGSFEEAVSICLNYLDTYEACPEVYFLLGVLQQALGQFERAENFFQKTIYLDPSHYEALSYLALLKEKRGEFPQAELLRLRAHKVKKIIKSGS